MVTLRFVPPRFDKTYFHWLENIRDWCISRQLWWGHQNSCITIVMIVGKWLLQKKIMLVCPKCGKEIETGS